MSQSTQSPNKKRRGAPDAHGRLRLQLHVDPTMHEVLHAELMKLPAGNPRTDRLQLLASEALLMRRIRGEGTSVATVLFPNEHVKPKLSVTEGWVGHVEPDAQAKSKSLQSPTAITQVVDSKPTFEDRPIYLSGQNKSKVDVQEFIVPPREEAPQLETERQESAARRAARGLSDSLLGG